ncbi:hypothetical protein CDL15_Pgr010353 [Punica granatum]|uniref:Sugar phosphate transporter domain-containing protein n=1 Tax=Punica granatum TaxID=22663 RepID=A0A218W3N0_PUNGR|nr:hypothetical protein CDL15_Pgr010353 [Punica granatum]
MVPEVAALPKVSKPFFLALLGHGLFYIVGHISTCVSFSKVVVFFTHLIKPVEERHTPAILRHDFGDVINIALGTVLTNVS